MGLLYFWTDHFIALSCVIKKALGYAKWTSIRQVMVKKKFFQLWPIIPSSFPPTLWVKNCGLNVCKTSCDSSTNFAYLNSWQKVDGETSVVKFGHHSRVYLEGLTKFWDFRGSSAPAYSPFCTLKTRACHGYRNTHSDQVTDMVLDFSTLWHTMYLYHSIMGMIQVNYNKVGLIFTALKLFFFLILY